MPNQYPEIYTQFLANIIIAISLIGFIITILLLYQKRKLLQEKEIQNLKSSFEKEMLRTQLEIQEDILKNISQEIHDNIGQIMLLANVNISLLQNMPMEAPAADLLKDTKDLVKKAIEDISQLSRGLHSERITEMGAFAAMQYELELFAQKKIFSITVENNLEYADAGILSANTHLLLFRMFQEIMSNIIKHASAKNVELRIVKMDDGIHIEISDNGKGFNFDTENSHQPAFNGIGLRSLQSRASLFNGRVSIKSVLQIGTTISIFIPET
ncbi:sensor histidine kinase [Sediminibacterium ginsengisoli]|uniref:histidine kinase n=1 Tax=Sediminibacterium ginsengisoli TaxID=413434 RepID=A0A1T4PAA8_9BACT|nr:ATP-binding protein [Sediminibacterium ginsengisoli]SJZ88432.1 hypothetical protein SAMN04488132_105238 [Sediminibacterium ginsengisoli]